MAETRPLFVRGMTCDGCVRSVRTVLERLPGVTVVSVDVAGPVTIETTGETSESAVRDAIEEAGYTLDADA